jgi:hypothetical protein
VHPENYPDDQIREIVLEKELDFIGMNYLHRLRRSCAPPIPFYPHDRYHPVSFRFLAQHQILYFFHPDRNAKRAHQLLEIPRAKEVIEASTITGHEAGWISAVLKRQGVRCTAEAVSLFQNFYWNLDLIDRADIPTLLSCRANVAPNGDPDEQALLAASLGKRNTTDLRLLASFNSTPVAGILHELRMGQMPANAELARIASASRLTATAGVLDALNKGQSAERCRDLALTAKIMSEMMELVGDPEAELQETFRALQLETDDQPVPEIKKLTDGRHTVDLQPTGEKEEEEIIDAEFE